ncbi:MAG: biotin/lipoyl-binding protein, partial [Xanthobacteraceae bacterium]
MDQRVDSERRSDSGLGSPNREAAAGDTAAKAAKGGLLRKRRGLVAALIIGGVILAVLLGLWWINARQYESTDDAFIDARTVQISAQVAAAIVNVPVTDNQMVEAGAELVRLDDRDYIA